MTIRTLMEEIGAGFTARTKYWLALAKLRKRSQPATGVLVGEALRDHWLKRLPKGERQVFQILVLAWPNLQTRESLCRQTGYKRALLDIYISRLQRRGLVETIFDAEVKATESLFKQ